LQDKFLSKQIKKPSSAGAGGGFFNISEMAVSGLDTIAYLSYFILNTGA
jgi:hypothetical protein